ncbi:MAG: ABC transporter permease [Crenarchaeota archaeon]|nr:ABC transporter permease [Thermoproteota archaeon]
MHWLVRRALISFATIFAAITITFFIAEAEPIDPIRALASQMVYQYHIPWSEAYSIARAAAPFIPRGNPVEQYFHYIINFFQGKLGLSITVATGVPVTEILAKAIPWTVLVVGTALLISFGVGVLIGMAMAYVHGSKLDSALIVVFSVLRSIPNYIIALVLLIYLAFQLRIFPTGGTYDLAGLEALKHGNILGYIADVLWHATLPILSWVITSVGWWALVMRGSTISVLGEDFITYAKARGLPSSRITTVYIGKNALLPIFTLLMISIGFMFGGSVIIEKIFNYQGMGWYLYQAVMNKDIFLMMGAFDVIIIAVIVSLFIADIAYGLLDPRVRRGGPA